LGYIIRKVRENVKVFFFSTGRKKYIFEITVYKPNIIVFVVLYLKLQIINQTLLYFCIVFEITNYKPNIIVSFGIVFEITNYKPNITVFLYCICHTNYKPNIIVFLYCI